MDLKKYLIPWIIVLIVTSVSIYLIVDYTRSTRVTVFNAEAEKAIKEEALKVYSKEEVDSHCVDYINSGKDIILVNYSECSKNLPNYCKGGKLVNYCDKCGCNNESICAKNGTCEYIEESLGAGGEAPEDEEGLDGGPGGPGGAAGGAPGAGGDSNTTEIPPDTTVEDNATIETNTTTNTTQTCNDNILNQDETNIDCGGVCGGYWYNNICNQLPQPTCSDEIQNQGETGVDCGGPCSSCGGGGDGGGSSPECYIEPVDSQGLTIFTASVCHDPKGEYSNSCTSPVDGVQSETFIKTYTCINNVCTPKYYSCPVKGQEVFSQLGYRCNNGACTQ